MLVACFPRATIPETLIAAIELRIKILMIMLAYLQIIRGPELNVISNICPPLAFFQMF